MTTLRLRPSRCERRTVLGLHGLAALAVALSAVPVLLALLLWIALASSACAYWRAGSGGGRVVALGLAADHCVVHYAHGTLRAEAPRALFVSEWLLVLRIGRGDRQRPLLLMLWPGSLSGRDGWRLRRYLRGYPLTLG
ncbi:MAG: hypothetical protein WD396_04155, partial [Pseudohongiellaceae bacterium]